MELQQETADMKNIDNHHVTNKLTRRDAIKKIGYMVGGLTLAGFDGSAVRAQSQKSSSLHGNREARSAIANEGAPNPMRPAGSKPNIIAFFTDQERWDVTGASGNTTGLTPNFDRMAARGAYLQNFFTCQPVCGPARSCLQTGLFATQTGCWRNGLPLDDSYADTLAKIFKRGGYDTAYLGKWHLAEKGAGAVESKSRAGYDYWLASNVLEFTSDAYQVTLYDSDERAVHLPGYRVDALTDVAIRYISDRATIEMPFLMFLSYIEPHQQNSRDDFPAPDVYKETYRGKWIPPDLATLPSVVYDTDPHCADRCLPGYLGMIKRLDEALGRVQDALKSLGMDDDTVVMFVSDHGNHFKTRNREYKRSCHEASIHVPGAISRSWVRSRRADKEPGEFDRCPTDSS